MSNTIPSVSSRAPSTPAKAFNSEESRCNICQEEFDTGDEPEIPLTLSCGHMLGSVCLSRWLHVPDRKHGCPICRKTLFKAREEADDDELEEGEIEDEDVDMSLEEEEEALYATIRNDQPREDELSIEMHRIFGAWPSTSAVIDILRSPTMTRNPALVIESLLQDHLFSSSAPLRRTYSYREATSRLYAHITTALTATSNWLSTRPAFNSHACSQLHHHLHLSLHRTAAEFRAHDKTNLINLLKAGVFTSPRMDASFSLRLIIAEGISSTLLPFGDGANPASAHMYRVLDAMPYLCGVYQAINIAEERHPSHIAEYDFREVWEADMVPVLGGRRSFDLMSLPTTTAVGSQDQTGTEGDMSAISESVNQTLARAESLLGIQPGSEASHTAEPRTAEEDTETISRQIDRTLARAHELLRDMDGPQSVEEEGNIPHADTEPRRGRGGRRGRGRGRRGGNA